MPATGSTKANGVKINGICRWLDADAANLLRWGWSAPFRIARVGEASPSFYWVTADFQGERAVGLKLIKEELDGTAGKHYEVDAVRWTCTCQAFRFGKGLPCKHLSACKAGLRRLGLLRG